jgi:tryptophan-rich sensory protein
MAKRRIKFRLPCVRPGGAEFTWAAVSALAALIVALIVRAAAGSPYRVISYCGLRNIIPPVWVMVVSWTVWYILLGAAIGSVLGCCSCRDDVSRYKGGMLFVLMMALSYVWYPLFFGAAALFSALLVAEAVLLLSVLCALLFIRVRRWAAWVMLFFSAWMLYMVVLNVMCVFAQ